MTPRAHPKRTVEDCIALNVSSLVRPGLFRAPPGALCSSTWRDSKQRETLRIYFWWELLQTGQSFLHINERRHSPSSPVSSIDAQNIEIVETRLHFGSRRWFKCPGLAGGVLCEQGAGILTCRLTRVVSPAANVMDCCIAAPKRTISALMRC